MELHHLESRSRSNELDRMVDNANRASNFLKALAHESRLMILCILAEGEKSVSELEDLLNLRDATAKRSITSLPVKKRALSLAQSTTCFAASSVSVNPHRCYYGAGRNWAVFPVIQSAS